MACTDSKNFGAVEKLYCERARSNDTISTTNDSTPSDLDDFEESASSMGDTADEEKCEETAQCEKPQLTDNEVCDWSGDYELRVELPLLEARLKRRLGSGDEIICLLAKVFQHLCRTEQGKQITPFHSVRIPPVPLLDYITRIRKYMMCSDACFVLALVYIDRLVKIRPGFEVCKANVHRLVATSIVLAAKYHDDVFYSNAYYGKVVGMKTAELNKLESLLLQLMGWRIHTDAAELEQYMCAIAPSAA